MTVHVVLVTIIESDIVQELNVKDLTLALERQSIAITAFLSLVFVSSSIQIKHISLIKIKIIHLVDGGWGSTYLNCDVFPNTLNRVCDEPKPSVFGKPCPGDSFVASGVCESSK